jgi:S-adenosylmethionine-dependent methyltransferase
MRQTMSDGGFDARARCLEDRVYGTDKGYIRLTLIQEDLRDFLPAFPGGGLKVLDAGGGAGRFARCCARLGHRVILCDLSAKMLEMAAVANKDAAPAGEITLLRLDLQDPAIRDHGPFDLVALHGVAEWTAAPEALIRHACTLVRPGGMLSLLVFNPDKLLLKEGINGMLAAARPRRKQGGGLTPPGGLPPRLIRGLLADQGGTLRLQSGIRIFHGFFREIAPVLTREQWLAQERLHYRQEPFAGLGEHSHFLWQRPPSTGRRL